MANVIINDTHLSNIADAIRNKKGVSTTYLPSEMADAISSISTSGSVVVDGWNVATGYTTAERHSSYRDTIVFPESVNLNNANDYKVLFGVYEAMSYVARLESNNSSLSFLAYYSRGNSQPTVVDDLFTVAADSNIYDNDIKWDNSWTIENNKILFESNNSLYFSSSRQLDYSFVPIVIYK